MSSGGVVRGCSTEPIRTCPFGAGGYSLRIWVDEPKKRVVRRSLEIDRAAAPYSTPLVSPARRDHWQVVEGIIYRYQCGIARRDVTDDFGPGKTVWKRHQAWAADGTWDLILDVVLVHADVIACSRPSSSFCKALHIAKHAGVRCYSNSSCAYSATISMSD